MRSRANIYITALLCGIAVAAGASRLSAQSDWAAVDRAMGRKGAMQPGGVWKYGLPRGDLQVTVGGVRVRPALALGSWLAFERQPNRRGDVMAMGDLVLLEDEIAPVVAKLEAGNVEVSALHNHLQHESPRVMYLHVLAEGDPVRIARAVHDALALTRTPPATSATGEASPLELDTAAISRTLGRAGKANGGVYQVSVPRAKPVRMRGMVVAPAMGVATAFNFQPLGGGRAATTGDFVLTAGEVNPVVRALGQGGITVTALHSHMLGEEPRLYFMHFWGEGDTAGLARTLRSALDRAGVESPPS